MTESDFDSSLPEMALEGPYARLDEALKALDVSQRTLGLEIGVNESIISRAMNGHGGLERHWRAIVQVMGKRGVSADWLLNGNGIMASGTTSDKVPALKEPLPGAGAMLTELGTITADGVLSPAPPNRFKILRGHTAVQVMDNSMSPLLRSGQWAIVAESTDRIPRDGDVVMFQRSDTEAMVRRMRIERLADIGEVYVLEAVNQDKAWRPVVVMPSEKHRVMVVVGVSFE